MKKRKEADERERPRPHRLHSGGVERFVNKNKNMKRLGGGGRGGGGGGGLSLQSFANAKSTNNSYNPALLKKKKEFYKNAKHVSKYKKMMKQHIQQNDESEEDDEWKHWLLGNGEELFTLENEVYESSGAGRIDKEDKKNRKGSYNLHEVYLKKHEEQEKERREREAIFKAKQEEKENAESRRKALREKMFKKTRKGQPVMKYRIEHLLETLQGETS